MNTKNDNIIELKNVSKSYRMGDTEIKALSDVNLQIKRGDFLAIVGPSGSGKSTMMNLVGALLFSFLIGTLSGVLPAIQAARLKPTDALRYE